MAQDTTIYDIAAKAGVSASTVSRVINNYPYVNKETRAKVLKVLAENNYVQNEAARSLVTQNSKMAGILIADVRTTHHTEGVYYVEHEFSNNGYSCLIYNTGTDPENQAKYIQILSQRKVEAVVLMGSVFQNSTVQNAIMVYLPNTPVAICNGYMDGPNIYGVTADEYGGVMKAVKLLAGKGRKKLAFISNHITPSNQSKIDGFKDGLRLYCNAAEPIVMEVDSGDILEFEKATLQLLKNHPDTDAIIFSEDYIALAGLHSLCNIGIKVPEQVAVVGLNNSKYAEISNPSLTSIDNMLYDTSLIAVRNVLEVLRGGHVNRRMSIGSDIVERSST
ncbi:MAG: LacI family DNA-binding transcriptional regulator [Spirochaetales bacterium]|nr:LacI family DNA-binding transcriptional regulator [Spirochaetales bacterium]